VNSRIKRSTATRSCFHSKTPTTSPTRAIWSTAARRRPDADHRRHCRGRRQHQSRHPRRRQARLVVAHQQLRSVRGRRHRADRRVAGFIEQDVQAGSTTRAAAASTTTATASPTTTPPSAASPSGAIRSPPS
jgi:hypothetical protein